MGNKDKRARLRCKKRTRKLLLNSKTKKNIYETKVVDETFQVYCFAFNKSQKQKPNEEILKVHKKPVLATQKCMTGLCAKAIEREYAFIGCILLIRVT
jgi:hypothetical protein